MMTLCIQVEEYEEELEELTYDGKNTIIRNPIHP